MRIKVGSPEQRTRKPGPTELRNVRQERPIPGEYGGLFLVRSDGTREALTSAEQAQRANDQPGDLVFTGYASTFQDEYEVYGGPANGWGWYETIARGAFTVTMAERPDLMFLINHTDMPLARTKSGTLRLRVDDHGLFTEADLEKSDPDVQRLVPKMMRRDMDEMSFAFRVTKDRWEAHPDFPDDPMSLRIIEEVNLQKGDVSIVNYGANPYTTGATIDVVQAASYLAKADLSDVRRLAGEMSDHDRALALRTLSAALPQFRATDDDPAVLAAALDAVLDQIIGLLDGVDMEALDPDVAQACALIVAADSTADELLAALGVPDPDEEQENSDDTTDEDRSGDSAPVDGGSAPEGAPAAAPAAPAVPDAPAPAAPAPSAPPATPDAQPAATPAPPDTPDTTATPGEHPAPQQSPQDSPASGDGTYDSGDRGLTTDEATLAAKAEADARRRMADQATEREMDLLRAARNTNPTPPPEPTPNDLPPDAAAYAEARARIAERQARDRAAVVAAQEELDRMREERNRRYAPVTPPTPAGDPALVESAYHEAHATAQVRTLRREAADRAADDEIERLRAERNRPTPVPPPPAPEPDPPRNEEAYAAAAEEARVAAARRESAEAAAEEELQRLRAARNAPPPEAPAPEAPEVPEIIQAVYDEARAQIRERQARDHAAAEQAAIELQRMRERGEEPEPQPVAPGAQPPPLIRSAYEQQLTNLRRRAQAQLEEQVEATRAPAGIPTVGDLLDLHARDAAKVEHIDTEAYQEARRALLGEPA
jgi:HK97 family phage prohead protease